MSLIKADLEHIQKSVKTGKLDHDTAQDLARYSTALLSIVKDDDENSANKKKSVEKLSDAELEAMAKKYLGEKK